MDTEKLRKQRGPIIGFQNIDLERADTILNSRPYHDLPDNFEEIEATFTEACISGNFETLKDLHDTEKVAEFIDSANLTVDGWTSLQLGAILMRRIALGQSSFDFGERERELEGEKAYELLKDRECVKATIELAGEISDNIRLYLEVFSIIDSAIKEGKKYSDVYTVSIYADDSASSIALLDHVEERFKIKLRDWKHFQELAGLEDQPAEDVENCYFMGLEARYSLALDKVSIQGGSYDDLQAVNPKDFNLPEKWDGANKETTKESFINKHIFYYFKLGEMLGDRPRLKEVSELINAPYQKILKIFTDRL